MRTSSGGVPLSAATPLADISEAPDVPALEALGLPVQRLSAAQTVAVKQGKRETLSLTERSALVDPAGALVALAEPHAQDAGRMELLRVFMDGV